MIIEFQLLRFRDQQGTWWRCHLRYPIFVTHDDVVCEARVVDVALRAWLTRNMTHFTLMYQLSADRRLSLEFVVYGEDGQPEVAVHYDPPTAAQLVLRGPTKGEH